MKILDLHFGAFALAPSTYSLFPFPLPTAAATARSPNSSRTIHLSTHLLSYARQFFRMENSQHPRRRNRSSNIPQEHVTSPCSTTPPETPSEKTKEVATGFTDIYGALSPRRAGLISSSIVTLFYTMSPLNLINRRRVSNRHRIDGRQREKFEHVCSSPLLSCINVLTFDPGVV